MRTILIDVYRLLRGWRWWTVKVKVAMRGGTLKVGVGSYILDSGIRVAVGRRGTLIIGKDVCLRRNTTIDVLDKVVIGDDTLIAEMVTIRDHDHRITTGSTYRTSGFVSAPIIIGKNVWIGNKVTITSGTRIGDNAIIGANAVVTKDIDDNSVAVGVPAKIIRRIGDLDTVDGHSER